MKPKKRIALAFPIGLAFLERLVRGILDYARQQGGWVFTRAPEALSPSIQWLRHWLGDGAFILVTNSVDARIARKLPMPVVNLAGHLADPGVPSVTVDYRGTGHLAAEHLLERRFRRFGFYGTRGKWFSAERRDGFRETLEAAGGTCDILEVADLLNPRSKWTDQDAELERWVRRLRPPVGILASTDLRAAMVLDVCPRLGLRVPDDVALIGVDNDIVACEQCQPSLSSVSRNDWQTGWEAARLLDQLNRGQRVRETVVRVAPDGVVQRRSTDTLAIEDREVTLLVQHIREHLHERFGVERVLEKSSLSRRGLELRFQQCLGRSPYAFINEQRVERAKQLLAAPDRKTLTEIAAACGFSELRRFRLVFRRLTGMTPAQLRRRIVAG
jgi:LacI family transcriptional regulator